MVLQGHVDAEVTTDGITAENNVIENAIEGRFPASETASLVVVFAAAVKRNLDVVNIASKQRPAHLPIQKISIGDQRRQVATKFCVACLLEKGAEFLHDVH